MGLRRVAGQRDAGQVREPAGLDRSRSATASAVSSPASGAGRTSSKAIITLGAPNRGAPIANHINDWVGYNSALFSAVGNAFYWLGNLSYDQWWWLFPAIEGSLNWGGYIANFSIYHLLVEMGVQYGVPFVQEVYVGSPYLDWLNAGAGWEAATVPSRVGIANTASEYWRGGPFRLTNPEYAGELSILTSTAAAALDYWGFRRLRGGGPVRLAGALARLRPVGCGLLALELRRVLVPRHLRRSAYLVGALPAERRLRADVEPVLSGSDRELRSQRRTGAHAGDEAVRRVPCTPP